MSDSFDIFNLGVEDVETHQPERTTVNEVYKPTADDGKDGTYKALIRFVPNPENPRNSLIQKYVHWLTNSSGDGKLVDSPSSIGEKCPIADVFWKLRKSDSAVDRKSSEKLKRRQQYYSLIKIVKDPQNPELEGTYKVFKFGYKIKEKIDAELKPDFGEPTQVFDLFEGKNFELIITRQGEYNNYDKSKFSASTSAILMGDAPAERNKETMTAIKAELENAPSLVNYDYKAWDEDTRAFINDVLRMYLNPGDSISAMTSSSTSTPRKATTSATATTVVEAEAPAKTESKPAAAVSTDDDLDSFLNDLDI
jgi:hypothetical protein|tara:strand:- start:1956 stop:2882 length:927 start_codon:yes stop_codon:yes gene_type:complete